MHKLRLLLSPLRAFDAVARTGSVSGAALALHVTPGAVSQQMKWLEGRLGLPLFRKSGREIALTDAGALLARRIREPFDSLESALSEVVDTSPDKRVRVKVMPTFAICWLLPRLADFYALHANIDVEVSTTATTSADIQLDQSDFIVRHGVGQWTDAAFDHVFDDAFSPVCAPEIASQIHVAADVFKFNFLHSFMRPTAWEIWLKAADLHDHPIPRGRTLGTASMCYQGAIDGLGIAMAQMDYVQADLRSGRLVKPLDLIARTEAGYYLLCDPSKAERHAIRAFREWVQSMQRTEHVSLPTAGGSRSLNGASDL